IVLGVAAAAGVGVGAGLFVVHSSNASDANTLSGQIKKGHGTCAGPTADPRCTSLANKASSADTFGNGSTVAFVVGGAAAVAMVTYLLLPSAPRAATTGSILR